MATVSASGIGAGQYWRWVLLGLVSAIFFLSTGGAFSTLGVLLPEMISDLDWNWTQAGAGFTTLALMTGISSTVPAHTMKIGGQKTGIRLVYLTGGALLAAGFTLFALTDSFVTYLIAAGLVGVGYTQAGAVPAVKLLSSWFDRRRSFVIGVFFTSGALGSVAAPLAASYFLLSLGSWRLCWAVLAVAILVLSLAAAVLVREKTENDDTGEEEGSAHKQDGSDDDWTLAEVLRSPQYYILIAALTVTLLGTVTMNTWQVAHMQNLGVSAQIAASALSLHALMNAASRALGGIVIDRIGAKWVLASGLAAGVVGMTALAHAKTPLLITLFAIGDGYCFGIVTFASAIVLLKYYGAKNNPAILGTMNLVSTIAMIGPVLAGYIGDRAGGFSIVFIGVAIMMAIPFLMIVLMSQPVRARH
ncbi:MAG: MFS transporter [Pseudomonadota bacterium]